MVPFQGSPGIASPCTLPNSWKMVQILLIQRQRDKDWIQGVLPLASVFRNKLGKADT